MLRATTSTRNAARAARTAHEQSATPALTALVRDERGAQLVEYIILVGMVAIVAMAGFKVFGFSLRAKIDQQADTVQRHPGAVAPLATRFERTPGQRHRGRATRLPSHRLRTTCNRQKERSHSLDEKPYRHACFVRVDRRHGRPRSLQLVGRRQHPGAGERRGPAASPSNATFVNAQSAGDVDVEATYLSFPAATHPEMLNHVPGDILVGAKGGVGTKNPWGFLRKVTALPKQQGGRRSSSRRPPRRSRKPSRRRSSRRR